MHELRDQDQDDTLFEDEARHETFRRSRPRLFMTCLEARLSRALITDPLLMKIGTHVTFYRGNAVEAQSSILLYV